ncbi:MAG: hypothetical protein Q9M18_05105 [Mariprofundaceae bacterium]|nr:hypothetical protein [Mariprofundaceae bacterium]
MRKLCFIVLAAWLMTGCGRKEPPQAWVDKGEPRIAHLKLINAGPSKKLKLQLADGEGGVGYQLERSEIDPYCQCPSTWHPFTEVPPSRSYEGKTLERVLRFEIGGHYFLYRVRAIDALGRLGQWSETFQADEKK